MKNKEIESRSQLPATHNDHNNKRWTKGQATMK